MLNSFYSNKSVLALLFSTLFSIIIFFNNDLIFVKNTQKSWHYVKGIITRPLLELKSFINYKEDLLRLKLDRWLLDTRIKEIDGYDFSSIDLREISNIDNIGDIYISNPSNRSITSSNHFFYTANVLSNNFTHLSASFFIDIGLDQLSEKYQNNNIVVIDVYGNLVGKVVKSSISHSGALVQLISDVDSRVIVNKKGVPNSTALLVPISSGKFELVGNNNYNISLGDTLYTSYKSDVYVKNIPVCKVISVKNKDNSKSFKKIIVEPLADLKNMEYVFVIESKYENNKIEN